MNWSLPPIRAWLFALLIPAAFGAQASAPTSEARCAVWERELSFARTVAEHDRAKFAEHVHANAVFSAESATPQIGREAVLDRWAGLIAGTRIRLSWYPKQVVVGGNGDLAVSSGPALYEFVAPQKGEPDFMVGGFHSVWQRGDDGVWRVVFDDGVEPRTAGESDIETFRSGRQESCPTP